jgi:hypothetical protein
MIHMIVENFVYNKLSFGFSKWLLNTKNEFYKTLG